MGNGEKCLCILATIMLLAGICMAICVFLVLRREDIKLPEKDLKKPNKTMISSEGLTLQDIHKACGCPPESALKYEFQGPNKRIGDVEEEYPDDIPNVLRSEFLGKMPKKDDVKGFVLPSNLRLNVSKKAARSTWKHHRRLVSISFQSDADDPVDLAFECSGFAINRTHVLTVQTCVAHRKLSKIHLRRSSKFWSIEGLEYAVNGMVPLEDLALLSVDPSMEVSEFSVGPKSNLTWQEASSAGWIRNDRVYATYEVDEWKSSTCETCPKALLAERFPSCRRILGDPLVANDILMGFRACGNEFIPLVHLPLAPS